MPNENDNKLVTLADLKEAYDTLYNRDVTTVVTQSANGLMSSSDKIKLDGIAAGAQVNSVTSVNNQTGAVSITPANIGAVAKSGDIMNGSLAFNSTGYNGLGVQFSYPDSNNELNNSYSIYAATDGSFLYFVNYEPGIEWKYFMRFDNASGIVTLAQPLGIASGGTEATTWNGARENLGVIARPENVPFDANGVGTINTPNGFTPFAAVFDQNWVITVHPPNKIIARSVTDYNNLIYDTTVTISILYAKLA